MNAAVPRVDEAADVGPLPCRVMCCRCGIGDVVMSMPALRAWRGLMDRAAADGSPSGRVVWLATKPAVELLGVLARPGDEVRTYHDFGFRHWDDPGGAAERAATDRWLDALPEGSRFYGLMHAPRGFRDRVVARGFANQQEDAEAEWRAAQDGDGPRRFVWRAARLGWDLPGDDEPPATDFAVPDMHDAAAERWLDRHVPRWRDGARGGGGGGGGGPVAFACNGGSELKVWPEERLAAVLDVVLSRTPGRAVLVAGPDAERAARVMDRARDRQRVAVLGREHLLTTAGVLRRCRGLVSNDSGLLHLGGALGLPLVGVFGPTRAKLYMPRVQGLARARSRAVEPTGGSACCPLREPRGLGPPVCISEGRCRLEPNRCIEEVSTLAVARAVIHVFNLPRCRGYVPAAPRATMLAAR